MSRYVLINSKYVVVGWRLVFSNKEDINYILIRIVCFKKVKEKLLKVMVEILWVIFKVLFWFL